ncbi:MAG: hypothetical protein ACR2LQ_07830 [Acidimicrobiales bacterium]
MTVERQFAALAATEAACACRSAAGALRADAADRAVVAAPALGSWQGPHRATFDDAVDLLARASGRLERAGLALAAALDDAAVRAAGPGAGVTSGW